MKTKINYELILYPLLVLMAMWIVYWGEYVAAEDLTSFGIQPRTIKGLFGIMIAPLLHSKIDVNHIVNNSFPIVILFVALLYFYREIALKVFFWIWILSGLGTWIIGIDSKSIHIGMSSVIYGLTVFIFYSGIRSKNKQLQIISLLTVLVYGSLVWGVFPMENHVSWEGHLSGAVSGVILSMVYQDEIKEETRISIKLTQKIQSPELKNLKDTYQSNVSTTSNQQSYYSYSIKKKE
jgi:membrane associated rhomboid family serine protease